MQFVERLENGRQPGQVQLVHMEVGMEIDDSLQSLQFMQLAHERVQHLLSNATCRVFRVESKLVHDKVVEVSGPQLHIIRHGLGNQIQHMLVFGALCRCMYIPFDNTKAAIRLYLYLFRIYGSKSRAGEKGLVTLG